MNGLWQWRNERVQKRRKCAECKQWSTTRFEINLSFFLAIFTYIEATNVVAVNEVAIIIAPSSAITFTSTSEP